MTGRAKLFWRLMVRPLGREPVRMSLTILAVALGVAVVLAMDLAGTAATGSFRSSLETLTGTYNLEITATGGVPEEIVGRIATLPINLTISPRIEDFAVVASTKKSVVLLGLDLIGESNLLSSKKADATPDQATADESGMPDFSSDDSLWAGSSLGWRKGQQISLIVGDRERAFTVRGIYDDQNQPAIVMDIAAAQRVVSRNTRVDRILVNIPERENIDARTKQISALLPPGIEIRAAGTSTEENRKMLAAFRWNLKLLSYIALIVGAFLIYNTISVSVVRRRAEIGIARALGASRMDVLLAFTGEAAAIGVVGAAIGIPLGRIMASGAVRLMGATVDALYVSSRPGPIELDAASIFTALVVGIGVAVIAAYAPAREAAQITPIEAMARGRREFLVRVHSSRDLTIAVVLAAAAWAAAQAPAVGGKPLFGYLATVFAVSAGTLAIPAAISAVMKISATTLKRTGVAALLASRSLLGSLRRTSVLVGALATAIAMMTAVGIMVGSFRTTVIQWMEGEVPADFYLRPAGNPSVDRHPTISTELADKLATLPGVEAVHRLRAYQVSFDGVPTTVAAADLRESQKRGRSDFFSGRPAEEVWNELRSGDAVVVSEPFTYKHNLKRNDSISVRLGTSLATFRIADVYYDYGSERGFILMDRSAMKKYLPDDAPSNLAVYAKDGADRLAVRKEIERAAADYRVLIFSNGDLRKQAIVIFDKTFAITYALEAVAVLVAVMGVAGALLALVIDRKRELGLLRFLGASRVQIRRMILAEAALLGLLANAAGLLLGFALSLILIFVINKQSFGWTIRFHWPVAILTGAISLIFAATVLAGFYPARVAVQLNPVEVVHEE
ncbi:MAG TPA: FtsX-like permease family protein [Candidatus Dormibacteraeota bacterium]|nr:FtsX-like permease family protein [Candidatus Dormibacteraeota bacterium]